MEKYIFVIAYNANIYRLLYWNVKVIFMIEKSEGTSLNRTITMKKYIKNFAGTYT